MERRHAKLRRSSRESLQSCWDTWCLRQPVESDSKKAAKTARTAMQSADRFLESNLTEAPARKTSLVTEEKASDFWLRRKLLLPRLFQTWRRESFNSEISCSSFLASNRWLSSWFHCWLQATLSKPCWRFAVEVRKRRRTLQSSFSVLADHARSTSQARCLDRLKECQLQDATKRLSRQVLNAWRCISTFLSSKALSQVEAEQVRQRLLRSGFTGFHLAWQRATHLHLFVTAGVYRFYSRLLLAWRSVVHARAGVTRLGLKRRKLLLKTTVDAWSSWLQQRFHRRNREKCHVERRRRQHQKVVLDLLHDFSRQCRRRRAREFLIVRRQELGHCRRVVNTWHSWLRLASRNRHSWLSRQVHEADEVSRSSSQAEGTQLPDKLEFLEVVDELHGLVHQMACETVTLDEHQTQQKALEAALESEEQDCEELEQQLFNLELAARQEHLLACERVRHLDEDLRNVLLEQADLRSSLLQGCALAQAAREASETASVEVSEFEHQLEVAGQVCSELVNDRGRRIAEVEAWSKEQRSQMLHLEDDLQQLHAVAQLQQAELRRRQRLVDSQQWVSEAMTAAGDLAEHPSPEPPALSETMLSAETDSKFQVVVTRSSDLSDEDEQDEKVEVVETLILPARDA